MLNKKFKFTILGILLILFFSCTTDFTSTEDGNDPNKSEMTDIDGNIYKTVKIGDQWWMAENLKVTKFRNGDSIPYVTSDSIWSILKSGVYCVQNNADSNVETYGLLYNGYAVSDSRNIAPEVWHIPTDEDWKTLEIHLGMSQFEADDEFSRGTNEGGKLKETGMTHWDSPNTGAHNESGVSALPGGDRIKDGLFARKYITSEFWTSTEFGSYYLWYRTLSYNNSEIWRFNQSKNYGSSVRCIKD